LESSVLSTKEFGEFAKEFVMFAHITTRIEGRKDDDLLSKKGGTGFPYLTALDAKGRVTAKLTGGRSVEGFRAMMADGAKLDALRAKEKRTPDEEFSLLQHDMSVANVGVDEARASVAAAKGLSDAQKKDLDGALLGLEIEAAMPKPKNAEEAKSQAIAAGKTFAEMWAAGREPTDDQHIQPFFILMLDHAESTKDAALFEKALEKLRAKFGSNPQAAGFFKKQDARLAALKAGGNEPDPKKDGGPAK
jgi:hypothetical protein